MLAPEPGFPREAFPGRRAARPDRDLMAKNYACLPAWQAACAAALGCETRTEELKSAAGETLGLFHYAVIRSRLFGTRVISLPFSDESAVEPAEPARARETGRALLARLDAAAAAAGASSAELRGENPALDSLGGALEASIPYIRFELDLSHGYAALRAGYHSNISKNLAQGARRLEIELLKKPGTGQLRELYLIYLSQMKAFGSPPLPMTYFSTMAEAGLYVFFRARLGGRAAGMLAAIPDGVTLRADVNASLPEYAAAFPKVRLFDESIRWAAANGFQVYDFMRTRRGTGVHWHKAKWGGAEREIKYYYRAYGPGAKPEPEPSGILYRLAASGLRLMPASLLEKIGPAIRAGAGK